MKKNNNDNSFHNDFTPSSPPQEKETAVQKYLKFKCIQILFTRYLYYNKLFFCHLHFPISTVRNCE